ncbi:JAB domain-containing protein [Marinifilum caeruleilacunae]|uniref:DNA repair protein n=1 Tax=Marinifilum caeruleilacunae TaxID=2499076 RepID=A0ABX1X1I9_9BACT|nr:JAB domain-containing protein [Marinifilum caeruleilacunae]NOU62268.1 DNA repair protein [Marinifilum caeruleilacunae]
MTSLFSLNEISVSYSHRLKVTEQPKINSSSDVYELVCPTWDPDIDHKESFKVLLLTRANRVLGIVNLFIGGISGVSVDAKLVYQVALKCNAAGIILMHNHPSGNLSASEGDLQITRKLVEVGKLLDLPVIDHVIFTSESYYSFADEGLL